MSSQNKKKKGTPMPNLSALFPNVKIPETAQPLAGSTPVDLAGDRSGVQKWIASAMMGVPYPKLEVSKMIEKPDFSELDYIASNEQLLLVTAEQTTATAELLNDVTLKSRNMDTSPLILMLTGTAQITMITDIVPASCLLRPGEFDLGYLGKELCSAMTDEDDFTGRIDAKAPNMVTLADGVVTGALLGCLIKTAAQFPFLYVSNKEATAALTSPTDPAGNTYNNVTRLNALISWGQATIPLLVSESAAFGRCFRGYVSLLRAGVIQKDPCSFGQTTEVVYETRVALGIYRFILRKIAVFQSPSNLNLLKTTAAEQCQILECNAQFLRNLRLSSPLCYIATYNFSNIPDEAIFAASAAIQEAGAVDVSGKIRSFTVDAMRRLEYANLVMATLPNWTPLGEVK